MLAKRTYKNQVTIPKEVIHQVGEAEYFDVSCQDGVILLKPVEITRREDRLAGVRRKIKSLGLTEKDVQEAVRWARSRPHS
jgi:hypothetical protein